MITSRIYKTFANWRGIFSVPFSLLCPLVISIIIFSCERPAQHPEVQKVINENQLMLSDNQIRLANIKTDKIRKSPFKQTRAITGRLVRNEQQRDVITARAAGRIVKLYIKESGVTVKKGMPLYTLYSETLLTLQQEYVLAKAQVDDNGKTDKRYEALLNSAKHKLTLYGFTPRQIASLNVNNSNQAEIIFYASVSGIVTNVGAAEGQYVSEGSLVYKIERSDKVWVEGEIYPNETASVNVGDTMIVRIGTNKEVQTTVNFISPGYNNNAHVTIIRGTINNIDGKLKGGEHVAIYLLGSSDRAIIVPHNAVIRNGGVAYLFVLRGNNTFQRHSVLTGAEDGKHVEIIKGISEGDTVVVSGAYLLYSEFFLKGGT
jgi:Cu(I)/Ag(I) efflux system membrane fusion protein